MPDRGRVFRRALSWLPFGAPGNRSSGPARRFGSTEHLSTEAVAAFVDGELRMNAHLRAAHHLSLCAECAAEVDHQERARSALRDSRPIKMPSNLLGLLSQIPDSPRNKPDKPTGRPPLADPVRDGEQWGRGNRR